MLNRDTWSDDGVRVLLELGFLFWQQEHDSVGGTQYLSCYPTSTLPVVDIIDPITGGLLVRIEEYQSAEQMVERLARFMDSHQWGAMGDTVIATPSNFHVPQRRLHATEDLSQSAQEPSAQQEHAQAIEMELVGAVGQDDEMTLPGKDRGREELQDSSAPSAKRSKPPEPHTTLTADPTAHSAIHSGQRDGKPCLETQAQDLVSGIEASGAVDVGLLTSADVRLVWSRTSNLDAVLPELLDLARRRKGGMVCDPRKRACFGGKDTVRGQVSKVL